MKKRFKNKNVKNHAKSSAVAQLEDFITSEFTFYYTKISQHRNFYVENYGEDYIRGYFKGLFTLRDKARTIEMRGGNYNVEVIHENLPDIVDKDVTYAYIRTLVYRGKKIPVYSDDYGQQDIIFYKRRVIGGGAFNFLSDLDFISHVDDIDLEDLIKFLNEDTKDGRKNN